MEADTLLLQVAIVLLPGILWAKLDAGYGMKTKPSDTEFLLRAFQFGLVSYAITYLGYLIFGFEFQYFDIARAKSASVLNSKLAMEIVVACGVSLICAILWLYASTYKLITRFLQWIKATKTYGDEDVWDYTFNSNVAAAEYIHFRDFERSLVYAGWVTTFSETGKMREIVLRDARIYDFNSKLIAEVPSLYLSKDPKNIFIEFPYQTAKRKDSK